MAESLKNLENEYISLFKGKVVKHIYKKVFYLTPEKDQANGTVTIAKLSNTDGLVDANSKGGETVKVQFDTKNALSNVFPLGDDTKNSAQTNKVFYRLPVSTNMKVIYDNKVLVEKRLNISQFGEIQIAPAKGSKMLFNPNTGQIITNLK